MTRLAGGFGESGERQRLAAGFGFWQLDIRATAATEVEEDRGSEEAGKLLGHDEPSDTRLYIARRSVITVMPDRRKAR